MGIKIIDFCCFRFHYIISSSRKYLVYSAGRFTEQTGCVAASKRFFLFSTHIRIRPNYDYKKGINEFIKPLVLIVYNEIDYKLRPSKLSTLFVEHYKYHANLALIAKLRTNELYVCCEN